MAALRNWWQRGIVRQRWRAIFANASVSSGLCGQIMRLPIVFPRHSRQVERTHPGLFGQAGYDPQRLAQEVAYMAERADITEECVRLLVRKHFVETLDAGEAAGGA